MGAPEVTFSFYRDEYRGALGEGAFADSLPRAAPVVAARIWPNGPEGSEAAYMRAVCAAVDVDAAYGSTGGVASPASVSVGSISVTLGAGGDSTAYGADMRAAVDRELAGTGLLFAGLG